MKILFSYIRKNTWVAGLFLLFGLVFILMLRLSDLPMRDVLYALLLCVVLGLAVAAVDYGRYRRRTMQLWEICQSLPQELKPLPEAWEVQQQAWQEMVTVLNEEVRRTHTEADRRQFEMLDYYSLWAHQIKTPIAAMRLLLQEEEGAGREQLAEELFHIERYVDMALQYLRMRSESSDLLLAQYDLDGIVRQTVRKYAPLFIRSRVMLHYEPLHVRVLTDEKWLCFVLEQLLSNALKYTPQGGSVTIRLEAPSTLVLCDSGIGIAPEDLPRIFEKGFTGYNGRTDKKSTGIGLYLCKTVLDRLGHGIAVCSQPGRGTEVRLDLSSVESLRE